MPSVIVRRKPSPAFLEYSVRDKSRVQRLMKEAQRAREASTMRRTRIQKSILAIVGNAPLPLVVEALPHFTRFIMRFADLKDLLVYSHVIHGLVTNPHLSQRLANPFLGAAKQLKDFSHKKFLKRIRRPKWKERKYLIELSLQSMQYALNRHYPPPLEAIVFEDKKNIWKIHEFLLRHANANELKAYKQILSRARLQTLQTIPANCNQINADDHLVLEITRRFLKELIPHVRALKD